MSLIMLFNTESGERVQVTDSWYDAGDPVFSEDGKYLFFVSDRDFSPIYSATEWNHAYGDMSRIYMVTLAKATANPFAPENDEVSIRKSDGESGEKAKASDSKDKGKGKEETPAAPKVKPVVVDAEGIRDRTLVLPGLEVSNYRSLASAGDKLFYVEMSRKDFKSTLKSFDIKRKKETDHGNYGGFEISADGKKMMISAQGKYSIIDLPGGPVKPESFLDLNDMKVWVDKKVEWAQIYDESWRQMRDFFYVANMHGVDWPAMKEKYRVLLPWVNDRNDLNYLIGELIGELNVGHAYVNGGETAQPERIKTGLLGAKLSRHSSGYFRIDKILKGQNWDQGLRSPLTEVGVDAREGDFILAVNGKSTREVQDIYALLIGTAGRQVQLSLSSDPSGAVSRKVLVVPTSSEADLYYYNWVQENIRKVNEATNGEVGYIHIPDMVTTGLNEFAKYFYPQLTKKALIIDGRGNGG
ncbi:MAG TPA: PDZ domain-containing protein, partial [Bacteroidales bacterium]|nr:PDZ domain-containing protein [Bacteroidales bacterium]